MRNMLKVTLVFVMLITTVFAQAKITGDVRVRPRIDIKSTDGEETSNQSLILYWGRLNVDADIGGGYSFHTKLASNWVGHWAGYMGSQEDCAGDCDGDAEEDACGVCDGDATDPADCVQDGYSIGWGDVDLASGTIDNIANIKLFFYIKIFFNIY